MATSVEISKGVLVLETMSFNMLYGILRPMATEWEWFDGKLDLEIMQDYVSESQWEIDTTDKIVTKRGYQVVDHPKWIKKHDRALIECVSLTNGIDLFVNEEGSFDPLRPSVHLKDGWHDQTLLGTVIAVRHDEMGNTVGLKPSDKKSLELSGMFLIDFASGCMTPVLQMEPQDLTPVTN